MPLRSKPRLRSLGSGVLSAGPALAGEGQCSGRSPASRPRVRHRHGEPRLRPDRRQSQLAVHEQLHAAGECVHQLLRGRASEPDQLPGDRRRIELRSSERQQPRLAQRRLHAEHRLRHGVVRRFVQPAGLPDPGSGTDAATPVFDTTNEITPPDITSVTEIDGVQSIPAGSTVGKTIGDQLAERGLTWRSYQESLPPSGADGVNNSDGYYSNVNPITKSLPAETQTLINLYAVKHNPFAYFRSVQEGGERQRPVEHGGMRRPLRRPRVGPGAVVLVHRSEPVQRPARAGQRRPVLRFDPSTTGTQAGLNPALIYRGDLTIRRSLRRSTLLPPGAGATTPSSWSGTRTTTAPRPTPTRSC